MALVTREINENKLYALPSGNLNGEYSVNIQPPFTCGTFDRGYCRDRPSQHDFKVERLILE